MIEKFFNIRFVFGRNNIWSAIDTVIDEGRKGFIAVADGVVVTTAHRNETFRKCLNDSLFAICDSAWVPKYIRMIYGSKFMSQWDATDKNHYAHYCGSDIFMDSVKRRKHRMFFMGTRQSTLDGLKKNISKFNPDVEGMTFYELPFLSVEEFDYEAIAKMIDADGADIIWVALGAPKQCLFMQRLLPHLNKGVMLGVGAAFKFHSGTSEKRAPQWILNIHMEFMYRIFQAPKKQLRRCGWIVRTLPSMMFEEMKRKRSAERE